MIGFIFRDRPDSAGSGAGAFDGIAIVVRPFIGETVHVVSSYGDIQVNGFVRRNIDGLAGGSLF